jgi:hypothetical protein
MTRRWILLALAAALLAGCSPGRTGSSAPTPPTAAPAAPPTRTVPPSTLSSNTTLVSALPRLLRVVDGYHMYEVSPQQYEIIGKHVYQVLFREKLSDQGVRFGANYDPAKHLHFVLIDPGFSQLSARQILDRLLGII